MTQEELNQIKELINNALSEAMSKVLSKHTDNAKKLTATELIDIQQKRCELSQRLTEEGLKPEHEAELEKSLRKLPKTIPWDCNLQEIIDNFDYWDVVEKAKLCGFKYYNPSVGYETFPSVGHLIEDALEMAQRLRDEKCGRIQLGRLIMSKFWDEEHDESWYTLSYFIEHEENY